MKLGYKCLMALLAAAFIYSLVVISTTKKELQQFKDLYYGEMKVANDLRFKLGLSEFHAKKLETILRVEYPKLDLEFSMPEDFVKEIQK